jgi:hypothetical protein
MYYLNTWPLKCLSLMVEKLNTAGAYSAVIDCGRITAVRVQVLLHELRFCFLNRTVEDLCVLLL